MAEEKKQSFEQNTNRLNELVRNMEREDITLQDLVNNYVEALELVDKQYSLINEAKQQIELLKQKLGDDES
ncbi:exodeoxyribonuclease VII small subunit [Psittacicella gerlachiana]|uniref:Exodeoxyribonuclease VII small subunit n=1 Tax=Psittacicella gerlachiana TaxID=2028574 RepID=A0A3A1YGY2_9GAMM|nr:exodeoxyribonuclease VII small subunit [Psittacicella gerlachiana]RIY36716.1 exodeoxyribonuclease VII small subunit [Psittacicella gerlachiana]